MRRTARHLRCCFATLVACATSLACSPALADVLLSTSGSIGATSDFVFRGLSYSGGDPALQASLDLEMARGAYVGTFVSSTNPNPGPSPSAEVDLWAGYHRTLGNSMSTDLRYTHYMYPDDPRVADYDRDEFTASLGIRNALFLSATYSPNTEAIASTAGIATGDAWALEISALHQFTPRWSLALGGGRYLLSDVYEEDYDYWGATLSADFTPVEVHFAVLGADDTAERLFTSRAAGERFAVTVLYRFTVTH